MMARFCAHAETEESSTLIVWIYCSHLEKDTE